MRNLGKSHNLCLPTKESSKGIGVRLGVRGMPHSVLSKVEGVVVVPPADNPGDTGIKC